MSKGLTFFDKVYMQIPSNIGYTVIRVYASTIQIQRIVVFLYVNSSYILFTLNHFYRSYLTKNDIFFEAD